MAARAASAYEASKFFNGSKLTHEFAIFLNEMLDNIVKNINKPANIDYNPCIAACAALLQATTVALSAARAYCDDPTSANKQQEAERTAAIANNCSAAAHYLLESLNK